MGRNKGELDKIKPMLADLRDTFQQAELIQEQQQQLVLGHTENCLLLILLIAVRGRKEKEAGRRGAAIRSCRRLQMRRREMPMLKDELETLRLKQSSEYLKLLEVENSLLNFAQNIHPKFLQT